MTAPRRVLFLYWGRRGIGELSRQIFEAAIKHPDIDAYFSVAESNETFQNFDLNNNRILIISTFEHSGQIVQATVGWVAARAQLSKFIARHEIECVVNLMPHVWSPLVMDIIHRRSVKYAAVIHDATRHPGDITGFLRSWSEWGMKTDDYVFTLSRFVATELKKRKRFENYRIIPLFHPELTVQRAPTRHPPLPGEPWKLILAGRLQAYKGLEVFTQAMERLHRGGICVQPIVLGEGQIDSIRHRLLSLGSRIENKWIDHADMMREMQNCHAVVLTHLEASQSGIVAQALGACVPPIVTPIGGLVEQVEDGKTGIVATSTSPRDVEIAIRRLLENTNLYNDILENITTTRYDRSAQLFVDRIVENIFSNNDSTLF